LCIPDERDDIIAPVSIEIAYGTNLVADAQKVTPFACRGEIEIGCLSGECSQRHHGRQLDNHRGKTASSQQF
jgi:hypothetical protein